MVAIIISILSAAIGFFTGYFIYSVYIDKCVDL